MRTAADARRALLGLTLTASLVALACASDVTPPSETMPSEFAGAPEWLVKGCEAVESDADHGVICGIGSMGGTKNISLARTTAVARGRTEIARSLEVKVKAMLKDYQATTTGGEEFRLAALDEQHVVDVSKQITDFSLAGTEMRDMWVSRAGTVYALVVLDVEKFKDSVRQMTNLSEEIRKAVNKRAKAAFAELGDEIRTERRHRRR